MIELPNEDRVSLANLFAELGFNIGIEVGTEQGAYAKVLCDCNPGVKLYCVDPWLAYPGYREHVSQEKLDGFYRKTRELLSPYRAELIRETSLSAVDHFADGSLDFVYIDANHEFSHVVADITAWLPKIRKGGIISGHDYIRKKDMKFGVVEAVQGYTSAYDIKDWYVLGRKERVEGERRDRSRSWFWYV